MELIIITIINFFFGFNKNKSKLILFMNIKENIHKSDR